MSVQVRKYCFRRVQHDVSQESNADSQSRTIWVLADPESRLFAKTETLDLCGDRRLDFWYRYHCVSRFFIRPR